MEPEEPKELMTSRVEKQPLVGAQARGSIKTHPTKMPGSLHALANKRVSLEASHVPQTRRSGFLPTKTQLTNNLPDDKRSGSKLMPDSKPKLVNQPSSKTPLVQYLNESRPSLTRETTHKSAQTTPTILKKAPMLIVEPPAVKRGSFRGSFVAKKEPSRSGTSQGPNKDNFPSSRLTEKQPKPYIPLKNPVKVPEKQIASRREDKLVDNSNKTPTLQQQQSASVSSPNHILFRQCSEETASNNASLLVSEVREPPVSKEGGVINSQRVIPNYWAAAFHVGETDLSSADLLRKKFESETERGRSPFKLGDSSDLSLSPNSVGRKKADILRSNLRAKSPQFDAYRNQLAKKGARIPETSNGSYGIDDPIEISESVSKNEMFRQPEAFGVNSGFQGQTMGTSAVETDADLMEPVPLPPPQPNLTPKNVFHENVPQEPPVEEEKDRARRKSDAEKYARPGSVERRGHYEKLMSANATAINTDKMQIPIVPSKYLTHNPRLIGAHNLNLSEEPATGHSKANLHKATIGDKEADSSLPHEFFGQNFKSRVPTKLLSPQSSKLGESVASGPTEDKPTAVPLIERLMADARKFPKFDKATSIVKHFGKICAFAANTHRGKVRNYNEDRVSILLNAQKKFKMLSKDRASAPKNCSLFSIFDGHGGNSCSNYLKDNLHNALLESLDIEGLLIPSVKSIYRKLDEEYQRLSQGLGHNISGSCAITCMILDDSLIIFNVGDSRAILLKKDDRSVQEVTSDHKPDKLSEFSRIVENGGELYKVSSDIELFRNHFHFAKNYKEFKAIAELERQNAKVVFGPWRIKPGSLSVSRTFGDIEAKLPEFGGAPNIIVSDPEIFDQDINEADFLLLACELTSRRRLRQPFQRRDR
jgi:serine/threonine protein phosphatase PrpC